VGRARLFVTIAPESYRLPPTLAEAAAGEQNWSRPMCTASSTGSYMPARRCR